MQDYFLADDLSGALDAAGAFHRAGREVRIALTSEPWSAGAPGEVVALTTETRNASDEAAAACVKRVLMSAQARGGRLLYKKIDSTLRGPVAAELRALMDAMPSVRVLFAPANPRVGRTVRDGVLFVHGVPVAETEFGRDPGKPLRTSSIREVLGEVAERQVVIPDVSEAPDLSLAVEEMDRGCGPWVGVGSGALVLAIAARNGSAAGMQRRGEPSANDQTKFPGPVLFIGGRSQPLNRRQTEALVLQAGVSRHVISISSTGEFSGSAMHAALESLRMNGAAILQLPEERGLPDVALRAIADDAVALVEATGVRRIFATGGETAFALSKRLGITSLKFIDEIEPGLALATGDSRVGPLLLAVKPGGFGGNDAWVQAFRALGGLGSAAV